MNQSPSGMHRIAEAADVVQLPAQAADVADVNGHALAVDGLDAMTRRGLPLRAALPPVAAQIGITLLVSAAALTRFQLEE